MKQLLKRLGLLSAAIILLSGCAETNIPTPQPDIKKPVPQEQKEIAADKTPSDYFPLTNGSTWQYQGKGNEYAAFNRVVIFVAGNKAQIREDNGGTVSASVIETTDTGIVITYFQGESYDETNFLAQESNENLIILKVPLKNGTKWEYRTGTREIVDVKASMDTPAGKFEDCIAVKVSLPDSTLFEYFKDGVGMVKREFISGDSRITSTLEKFNIN